jgi:hypothetical protein
MRLPGLSVKVLREGLVRGSTSGGSGFMFACLQLLIGLAASQCSLIPVMAGDLLCKLRAVNQSPSHLEGVYCLAIISIR